MKARTELKFAASASIFTALVFAVAVAWAIPLYARFRSTPWQQMFRTQQMQDHFLESFRMFAFIAAPALVILSAAVAWLILKNLRKISDETNA
jgi:hypothetical protein